MLMIPQSTAKVVVFKAFVSTDHVTEATGKLIAITISKNGATSFSNLNAGATNATEMASGWYKVTLDTTDTATNGPLAIRGAVAGIDDVGILLEVVNATNFGMTALPATAVTTNASLITSGTGAAQIAVSGAGAVTTVTTTTNLTNAPTSGDLTSTMKTSVATAALTTAMTESYAANGVAPTLAQATFAMHQYLMDFGISSTTYTVKKLDNSTTAFAVTLNSATTPTAAART